MVDTNPKIKKYVFGIVAILMIIGFITSKCGGGEPEFSINYAYDCVEGSYGFPEEEPLFKKVSIYFTDWEELKDDECIFYPEYKKGIKTEPYTELEQDECKITITTLASLKEQNADLKTILKASECERNTNRFLD